MSQNTIASGAPARRTLAWPLELEVELRATDRREVTAEQLDLLTALLNETEGVSLATAEVHSYANLVHVLLTVDAHDQHDALDRVCTLVRGCVSGAGLGPAILVAARPAARRPAARRMG